MTAAQKQQDALLKKEQIKATIDAIQRRLAETKGEKERVHYCLGVDREAERGKGEGARCRTRKERDEHRPGRGTFRCSACF